MKNEFPNSDQKKKITPVPAEKPRPEPHKYHRQRKAGAMSKIPGSKCCTKARLIFIVEHLRFHPGIRK